MASTRSCHGARSDHASDYDAYIGEMRRVQYPMLNDTVYLDHAGTTLYSKKLMEAFHADMMATLYGNPHSASPSSQTSTQQIENTRLGLLRYFGADPDHFDLIFTANATAAIKIVMSAFREQQEGFSFAYHVDSHTSVVGVREAARDHTCLQTHGEVERWILRGGDQALPRLFAYPAQSNMNGRRLPLQWCRQARQACNGTYTLLDAAAYVSTSALDLADVEAAPDFTTVSLYKIFGFPDLGALIVRKCAADLFRRRKYFGGGTVDMVVCLKEQWHVLKAGSLHEQLEDGTLPVHSIVALKAAMETHNELYGGMGKVAKHTAYLAKKLFDGLAAVKHGNGRHVCQMYKHESSTYGDAVSQGPIVAFNLRDSTGGWVSNVEVDKLALVKNIHVRTGGLCNPGGIASCLDLDPWEMRDNFSSGFRCGAENGVMNGKPTGMIRASFGAMSTASDVDALLVFIDEFFTSKALPPLRPPSPLLLEGNSAPRFHVESLTVYPIKSCAGWQVPDGKAWEVRLEGLTWDREWCIVHRASGAALSQKRHPRMALIRPELDFNAGKLRIRVSGRGDEVSVPLSLDPGCFQGKEVARKHNASVCGDPIQARLYNSQEVAEFLTQAIGVPCTLARFPAAGAAAYPARRSKAQPGRDSSNNGGRPILLSNESPILTISRSSLNRLNEQIKAKGGKAAHPAVFRANIIIAESPLLPPGREQPWAEDGWTGMRMVSSGGQQGGGVDFDVLGGCGRCQMVCVDQVSGEKNEEPFVTLAKTRRSRGRVLFGVHTAVVPGVKAACATIRAGDIVEPVCGG